MVAGNSSKLQNAPLLAHAKKRKLKTKKRGKSISKGNVAPPVYAM